VLDREPEIHVGPKARKAAPKRIPVSRDREVGPARKRVDGRVGRRSRLYTFIDQGSRADWNIRRLSRNARKFEAAIAKTERQLARFRQRLRHYERHARSQPKPAVKGFRLPQMMSALAKPTEMNLMGSQRAQRAHSLRRQAQVLWLIGSKFTCLVRWAGNAPDRCRSRVRTQLGHQVIAAAMRTPARKFLTSLS
jgi:hypothetical protein